MTESGIYILFEKYDSHSDDSINNYDCIGYTTDEKSAMAWRDANIEFRTYKYCCNNCKDIANRGI